jgi:hypothetical protein
MATKQTWIVGAPVATDAVLENCALAVMIVLVASVATPRRLQVPREKWAFFLQRGGGGASVGGGALGGDAMPPPSRYMHTCYIHTYIHTYTYKHTYIYQGRDVTTSFCVGEGKVGGGGLIDN